MLAKELRTSRERTLFGISATFSALVWLVLVVTVVGLLYGALIGLFLLIGHCLLMAHLMGNGVRIGSNQLPNLMARIDRAARKLGLEKTPEAYVVQSGGLLNAFATKILSRRFIILYSDLVEACEGGSNEEPNELDFVIGHEIGHVAAGHLAFRLFLLPARILPWIGPAYSRACEYTCDRCGHEVVGDLGISSRALAILAAGPLTARRMNLDAFADQRAEAGRFWMAVYELNATHPFLSKRVAALRQWKQVSVGSSARRNPWAYLFAPLFGVMSGNPASALGMVVVVCAIVFAVALPRIRQQTAGLLNAAALSGAGVRSAGTQDVAPSGDDDLARFRKELEQAEKQQQPSPP